MTTRILKVALGAVFLAALGTVAQPRAAAQEAVPGNLTPQGQNPKGLHVFIWAGLKSHGEGAHDYPQFLADWSKLLTQHGAVVEGALRAPSAEDLEHTDVVVLYKGDAGYMTDTEKSALNAYIKRGGGFVSLHDSLCGPDPAYFATITGGAKKHGEVNFSQGELHYTVVDKGDPILKDMTDMTITDESFFSITWASNPGVHALVTTVIPGGAHKDEVVPQMWTWEHTVPGGQPARAFVWMQGHYYTSFSNPQIQPTLLRGIAWAAKKPVDDLIPLYVPPARGGRGGRGGSGRGGRGAGRGAQ